jgi:hypothetical protein
MYWLEVRNRDAKGGAELRVIAVTAGDTNM